MRVLAGSGLQISGVTVVPRTSQFHPLAYASILMCDDTQCDLFGADVDLNAVSLINPLLMDSLIADVNTLYSDESREYICAYGSGLFCIEHESSGFRPVQGLGSEFSVNRVIKYSDKWLGVANSGLIFPIDHGDGEIESFPHAGQIDIQTDADIVSVIADESVYVAALSDRTLFNSNLGFTNCEVSDEAILAMAYRPSYMDLSAKATILGVTELGRLFVGRETLEGFPSLCFTGQIVQNVIDINVSSCGASDNFLVLAKGALFGNNSCIITK